MDEEKIENEDIKEEVPEKKEEKKQKSKNREVEKLKKELEEEKNSYLRLAAEFDNYKKRTKKEMDDRYNDARSDVVKGILPLVDNLERALKFSESEKVVDGVRMTYTKFEKFLEDNGIKEIECKTFDPNLHNAVMHIEDDSYGENEIIEVFEKGYILGDKVIRYAMVKVAN